MANHDATPEPPPDDLEQAFIDIGLRPPLVETEAAIANLEALIQTNLNYAHNASAQDDAARMAELREEREALQQRLAFQRHLANSKN
jgi:hypothetical protein